MKAAKLLALGLAVCHLCLAIWFASVTPYRTAGVIASMRDHPAGDIGAPDERQHVNYAIHLLQGKGFPVLDPKDPNLGEDYQSHQPPLFYLLEAGWTTLTRADPESPNDGVKMRALTALIGAGEVFAVFCLGWWGFKRPEIGVVSAAFAAFLPMNVALSGAVSNDPLLFLLCTAALANSVLAIQEGWTNRRALLVGVFVGLAILTKTTGLAVIPPVLLAVVLTANDERPTVKQWGLALAPIVLISMLWLLRNQHLYGDPFAISAFNQAFTGSPQAKPFIDEMGLFGYLVTFVGWWTARSFFGAFGYMDIFLNETGLPAALANKDALYRVLFAFTALAFIGWLFSWKQMNDRKTRAVQIVNVTFFVVTLLLFVRFNMQYFQAQARYLFPAIGPISCGFGIGLTTLTKNRWPVALGLLVVLLGGTSVYAALRLPDEFGKRSAFHSSF